MSKIDHPEYYRAGGIEAIDVIEDWKLDFCLGNAIKYIARAGKKSDDVKTDLEKAAWYIKRHWDSVKNGNVEQIPEQTHTKYHMEVVLCQDLKQIKMRIFHRKINICSLSCIYTII